MGRKGKEIVRSIRTAHTYSPAEQDSSDAPPPPPCLTRDRPAHPDSWLDSWAKLMIFQVLTSDIVCSINVVLPSTQRGGRMGYSDLVVWSVLVAQLLCMYLRLRRPFDWLTLSLMLGKSRPIVGQTGYFAGFCQCTILAGSVDSNGVHG